MTEQHAALFPFRDLPEGTVTFLFSDIEGSTQLLYRLGDRFAAVLAEHHRILREAVAHHGGHVVRTEGDSFFVAFPRATSAVAAAVEAQRSLAQHPWPVGAAIRVRMGLHTGEPEVALDDYVGISVHRAARIAGVGHGGQVLLSETTAALARDELPPGVSLSDLGSHLLKDLHRAEHIFQLAIEGLPSTFPPLKTPGGRPHHLPAQLTSFVGRQAELAALARLVDDPAVRLVTIAGLGGMGKTRLALEAAAAQADRFSEGAWFVPLAPVQTGSGIVPAIAQALGLALRDGSEPLDQLLRYLRDKELLLLLDNLEHLLAGPEPDRRSGGEAIAALLAAAPRAKILATSRLRLGVPGEQLFQLGGMDLPDGAMPAQARQSGALELFLQGARRVRPGFELAAGDVRHVAAICRAVGGMPLGVLLAAAWVEMLTPAEIAAEVLHSPDLLETAGQQRSIRAVFDYSWSHLTPPERHVYAGLSVFRGGFTREAAQSVTGATLRELLGLVNKSLLSRGAAGRFEMHELLRQYAAEELSHSGRAADATRRHLEYYLGLAEQFELERSGPDVPGWIMRLAAEIENVRAALSASLAPGHSQTGLRLALCLFWFWQSSGFNREGRDWLERLLAEAPQPSPDRVQALQRLAVLAEDGGEDARGMALREQALIAAKSLGVPEMLAATACTLASRLYGRGFVGRALQLAEHCLSLCQGRTELRGEAARATMLMGELAYSTGDTQRGQELHQQALAMFGDLEEPKQTGWALLGLGDQAQIKGDLERARALHEECTALWRSLDDRYVLGVELSNLASVLTALGELERSQSLLIESLPLVQALAIDVLDWPLVEFGLLAHARGQAVRAVHLLGAADAVRQPTGRGIGTCTRREYDRAVAELRAQLGEAAFAAAWAEGRAMNLQEAVELAMSGRA